LSLPKPLLRVVTAVSYGGSSWIAISSGRPADEFGQCANFFT